MTTQPRHYAAARSSYAGEIAAAGRDFAASFRLFDLWRALALNDIVTRYRGSVLGPFWITLTTAAFAVGIGLVYSEIMQIPATRYLPWIATGVVFWNFLSMTIIEGSTAYISEGVVIRQSSTPLPVFIWRVILRNLINFAHQAPVLIAVAVYFYNQPDPGGHYLPHINLPMAGLGLLLMTLNLSWMVMFCAIASARFRDILQVIATGLQILFFLSPVIWIPGESRGVTTLLLANPVYHLLEITRNPLLGMEVPPASLLFVTAMAAAGWAATFFLYASVRRRIVHYL